MKTILPAISFLLAALLSGAEKEVDPFAHVPPKEVERGNDKGSADFIDDDLLTTLNEPRLDKGTGKGGPGLIRITVLRSFHSPLVFIWYPAAGEQEPSIQVKRVKMKPEENGARVYTGLEVNTRVKLLTSQDKNLKKLFENANFDGLGQACWQGGGMDGSLWIYERAAEDGWTLIARNNPINPQSEVDHSTISKQQLLQESNLTTFALMIWALSGIDEDSIY